MADPPDTRPQSHPFRIPIPAAITIIVSAWIPFLLVMTLIVPRFVPIYDRWQTRFELPFFTRMILPLGRLGPGAVFCLVVVFLALMSAAYAFVVRSGSVRRVTLALLLSGLGLLAFGAAMAGIVLPPYYFPEAT
jgi:type II secretory pathway component PulF